MGEAWSDWYAMDYLVDQGLQRDTAGEGRRACCSSTTAPASSSTAPSRSTARSAQTAAAVHRRRDRPRAAATPTPTTATSSAAPRCTATARSGRRPCGTCARELGSTTTESLVTRAMELAPSNPSFLDMRNAILVADTAVVRRPATAHAIWKVFAHRGMGFFAGSPRRRRHRRPVRTSTPRRPTTTRAPSPARSPTPTPASRSPGITVTLAFQGGSGSGEPVRQSPVPTARYSHRPGAGRHVPEAHRVRCRLRPAPEARSRSTKAGAVKDFTVRRDWAASSGGASIADFNGPDFGPALRARPGDRHQPGHRLGLARPATTTGTRRTCSSRSSW